MPALRIWQEIHCTLSGGGCGGYILVKLNTALNDHRVEMICPKCQHKHVRVIQNGVVQEQGRFASKTSEEICPTLAAWSEKPRTLTMKKKKPISKKDGTPAYFNERDGVVIQDVELSGEEIAAQQILRESWSDRFLGKLCGR